MNLNRNELSNRIVVGGFLLEFLDKDPYCKELKSDWLNQWAAAGLLASFSRVYLNAEPTTKNLVPWFMDRVASDLLTLQNSNEQQLKASLISCQSVIWLRLNQ